MSHKEDHVRPESPAAGAGGVTIRQPMKMRPSPDHEDDSEPHHERYQKFNFKVPSFSAEDPELWFAMLERQFDIHGITEDADKFNYVTTNLDITHAKTVKEIIVNPPHNNRYLKLKSELIKRLTASHENKLRQLLSHERLGDRKPSQFLRYLQDLAGINVPEDFLRTIWCDRLPQNVQTVLASQPTHSLDQLAELADRIMEITTPLHVAAASTSGTSEIAELRQMVERLAVKLDEHTRATRYSDRSRPQQRNAGGRNGSRSRSRSASSYRRFPVCWYHWKFGSKAHKCQMPCDFKAGNAAGNR